MADILITHAENFSPEARRALEVAGHRLWMADDDIACAIMTDKALEGGSFMARRRRFTNVLWLRLERIGAAELDQFPNLNVLATNCTDVSHLPLEECARRNIRVVSLQDCREQMPSVHSTAEHTLCLILALLRKLPAACDHVKEGGWDRWQFVGRELHGKVVGLIGYGRVGKQVHQMLYGGFGVPVAWFDPGDEFEHNLTHLGILLARADIVSVHASLHDGWQVDEYGEGGHRVIKRHASRGLCNGEFFNAMKPGAYFINTARGAIVDEGALLGALESGRLAGAALDVVQDEPNVNRELVEFARREPGRLLLTPHIGGMAIESQHRTEEILAAKLVEVLAEPKKKIVADPRFLDGPIPD